MYIWREQTRVKWDRAEVFSSHGNTRPRDTQGNYILLNMKIATEKSKVACIWVFNYSREPWFCLLVVYLEPPIALYWQEKPTSLMNENEGIDNPRKNNRRVRWRELLRWKNSLHHGYKNFNGRNFQFTKFSFIDFVFTDRWSLSGRWPKSVSGKSSSCRSLFSAERLTPKPLKT